MRTHRHLYRAAAVLAAVAATCSAQTSALAAPTIPVAPAGACGDLRVDSRPDKLVMRVGQDRPLSVTFTSEHPCTFTAWVLGLERRNPGIAITPAHKVQISTPATFTWRITGTRPTSDVLVARLYGSDFTTGFRLPDVEVRKARARSK